MVIYFLKVFKDNAFVLIPRGLMFVPDLEVYGMRRSKMKDL